MIFYRHAERLNKKKMKDEIKHIKWRLINQDGLTPKQADQRIQNLKNWDNKMKKQKKMGQSECMEILDKADDWMTATQISEKLGQTPGLVKHFFFL